MKLRSWTDQPGAVVKGHMAGPELQRDLLLKHLETIMVLNDVLQLLIPLAQMPSSVMYNFEWPSHSHCLPLYSPTVLKYLLLKHTFNVCQTNITLSCHEVHHVLFSQVLFVPGQLQVTSGPNTMELCVLTGVITPTPCSQITYPA